MLEKLVKLEFEFVVYPVSFFQVPPETKRDCFNILVSLGAVLGRDYLKSKVLIRESVAYYGHGELSGLIHAASLFGGTLCCRFVHTKRRLSSMNQVKNQSCFFQHIFLVAASSETACTTLASSFTGYSAKSRLSALDLV